MCNQIVSSTGHQSGAAYVCRSAFFCFCNDERPKVKATHPNMPVGDVAKELGRRWEVCTNKAKYEALAAKDKARYEQVIQNSVFVCHYFRLQFLAINSWINC